MADWLTTIMNDFGYLGIILLIAVENIFPPIPSEVILTFGGFMTTTSELTIPGVVLSATGGSVLGAVVLYYIGVQLSVARLEKIIERWGHILRVSKDDVRKADGWFKKYGAWTVFFCRFIPLIRSLISIPAGMSKMNVLLFLGLTTLGTLIWNIVLVSLGAAVGNSWEEIVSYMDIYSNIVYVLIAVGVLILAVLYIRKRQSYDKGKDRT